MKKNNLIHLVTLLLLFFSSLMYGQITSGTAPVNPPLNGFNIDGKVIANSPIGDWVAGSTGAGVLDNFGIPIDNTTTFHLNDLFNSSSDDNFGGGTKYDDNPNNWTWLSTTANDKTDMNHALIHFTTDGVGNVWVIFAADRLSNSGNAYIDFEFFQTEVIKTGTGSGGFSTVAPASSGGRTAGDFILTVYFESGVAKFDILKWEQVAGVWQYKSYLSTVSGNVFAAGNSTAINVPYGAFGSTTYPSNTFIESAVNLTEVLQDIDPCLNIKVKTILVKSKTSTSTSAQLKDFFEPLQVNYTLVSAGGLVNGGTTICSGSTSGLLTLSGHTGTVVKWQSSVSPFSTWTDIPNTALTYTSGALTQTTQFRASVSGVCGDVFSEPTTVTVDPTSVGGSVTGGTTICSGSTSGLLTLSGHTGTVVKWQSSVAPFSTWTDIPNTALTYTSGALTQTTQFRAVVQSGVCSTANSSATTVTEDPTSVGGSVTGGTTICSGSTSGLLTLLGHTGTVVKWQSSVAPFSTWTDIPNTALTYTSGALTQTTQFRAVVQSGVCSTANSSATTVTVDPTSVGGTVAGSTAVCSGINSSTLTLSGYTGAIVRWESSEDNFATKTNIVNSTTTLTVTNLSATTKYRAVLKSGTCSETTSSVATITVNPLPIGINKVLTIDSGDILNVIISNHVDIAGSTFNWQAADNTNIVGETTTTNTATSITDTLTNLTGSIQEVVYTIIPTSLPGCVGSSFTITVNVNPKLPTISINDQLNVNEGSIANFTVSLSNTYIYDVTFIVNTLDGTAVAPGDYVAISSANYSIPAGSTTVNIPVTINNDNIYENLETYKVVLSNVIITTTNIPITTTDLIGDGSIVNTTAAPVVSIVSTTQASEPNTNGLFTLNLTNPISTPTTVFYTVGGTASNGVDYQTITTSVVIPANTTSITIPVVVIDDTYVEPTESVIITLVSTDNDVVVTSVVAEISATVTITDNDNANISINDVTVNEGDGTATFTVSLVGNVQGGFSVDFATADDTAKDPADYTAKTGTLNFTGTHGETQSITVPIIDDDLIEPTERFYVNLSNLSTTLIGILDNQGVGTIEDNDGGAQNGISINDVTVNEGDGTATFTVSLVGNVQGGFSVDFATADDTAKDPADYTAKTGTLNFTGTHGETQSITVPIIDDDLIEPTERFYVNLSNLSTTLIGILDNQGVGTIEDNDGGAQNGISINDVTVNEGDGTATFTVSLVGNVQGGFSVDFATADDTAKDPADYTAKTGTLTFTGTHGETQSITVPIIDDDLIEPTESFYVNLSNLSTTLIGILDNQGVGTIEDNDGGAQNGISINDVTVNEGDGTATFTVSLVGNVQGGFSVDFATADDTAKDPADYTAKTGTLTFTGTHGETQSITVPIIDDDLIEPTESFYVNLSNLSTTLISILDSQGVGTIEDNDGGAQNGISINDVTVNEGDGTATFTVSLVGNVQGGFSVDFATADDTAKDPADYTAKTGTLNFTGTHGETQSITVPIIDDDLIEPTESFYVNLSNLSTTLIGILDNQGVGTIEDNDGGAQNGISINDVTVNEGDGTATFTVSLVGNVQGGFSVDFATADDTAKDPADYTAKTGTLNFTGTHGETQSITVPIIDDDLIEPTERFYVNLSNLSTTLIGILDNQGVGTIEDNDGGAQNGISINDVTVNEGDGTATFTVSLVGNVQGGFSVDFATADDTAKDPADYTAKTGTLNFTGTHGETQSITVPIIDDDLIEPTERFYVNLSNLSTTLIGILDNQGVGTIEDNDGGAQNGISINDVTVNEGDGTATFTVSLVGNVQGGFSVDFATADDTAKDPADYTAKTGTLNFTGTHGETQSITVPIIDDDLIEPTESFYVNLSNLSTTLIGILDNQGVGTIEDNDGGAQNGISINDVTVNEGDGTATFTVSLVGNVQGGFSVDFATADDTAKDPADYTAKTGTLNFTGTHGETQSITVPIIDDDLIEPTESFYVNLSNLSTTLIGILDNQGVGTIEDNDGGAQNGISINDVTVNEGDGTATFTVSLVGNVQGGFSVDFATADDTAKDPADYTAKTGTLTFTGTHGETQSITVPIIDDDLIEPTESFYVNLSNLSTTLIGILDNQGVGTIEDNDGGSQNGISINDVTVNEGDGTATFTVSLVGNVQGGFSVDFATADDTAKDPADYTAKTGTLNFTGTHGETQSITVPIIDDDLIEPTESFYVNLSNLSTTLIGILDNQGVGTIEDNDGGAQNGISINDVTVNEGDGTATFTVSLVGNVQGGFSVDFATADDTAKDPADYTAKTGTLNFTGTHGETQSITVPIIDDDLIEPTESFYVNLSNLSTTLIGILDNQGVGTIIDYDIEVLDDTSSTNEDNSVIINVLGNDTFGSDDQVVVSSVSNPGNGSVLINADGTVTYIPILNFNGIDTFTYTVTVTNTDGSTSTASATVTITVNGALINAINDEFTAIECTTDGVIGNILSNDSLKGNQLNLDEIVITVLEGSNAFISINTTNGDVSISSGIAAGTYTFKYQVCRLAYPQICDIADITIMVIDTTKPVISILPQNTTIACPAIPVFAQATATDSCGNVTLVYNDVTSNASCTGTYTITRTWTATDMSGNITTASQVINVVDNLAPTAVCKSITVQLNSEGTVTILPSDIDGGSSDTCSAVKLSASKTTFTCADVGINKVILTVTDACGNSSTCEATVTVQDKVAPTVFCRDIEVTLDDNNIAVISAEMVNNGSYDACGIQSVTIDKDTFNFDDIGENFVTLTVTDINGNVSTCTAKVTVGGVLGVVACLTVFNEFTPNGDGINDYFKIKCIELYPNNTIEVYNRWGHKVYEKRNYNNDWDGTANTGNVIRRGEKLPVGTYYYILDLGDGTKPLSGWLYIQR